MAPAWRSNAECESHRTSEEAIINIPNRGKYVALRPAFFFSNLFMGDIHTIRDSNVITGCMAPNEKKMWISTTDISALAVNTLTESIEHHSDCTYEMTSEALSEDERAQLLSKVLGKDIKYVQRSALEEYKANISVGMPHETAYSLVEYYPQGQGHITRGLPILLGRDPESFEAWLEKNKQALLQ
ncbi:unnamed protein product [Umbelopsis ramanniana]